MNLRNLKKGGDNMVDNIKSCGKENELDRIIAERKNLAYYIMPNLFFIDERYKVMPLGAKMLYSIFRDRINLSKKNNKIDLVENNFYCFYSNEDLAKLLNVTKRTVINWKNLLISNNLIYYIEKGRGYRKSNKILLVKETEKEIENSMKDYGYFRISKKVLLDDDFKELTFKEKMFFEYLENVETINNIESLENVGKIDNKKSRPGKTTFLVKNIDLVKELNLSKPTIIKYLNKLQGLNLIKKDLNKLTLNKSLLKNVKSIYTDSINNFVKKVKGIGQKNGKKSKKIIKILLNLLENKKERLLEQKFLKDFLGFTEKLLRLNVFDIKVLLEKLQKVNFKNISNISNYVFKMIDNILDNRNVLGEYQKDLENSNYRNLNQGKKLILDDNLKKLVGTLENELNRKLTEREIRKIASSVFRIDNNTIDLFKIASIYSRYIKNTKIEYIIGVVRNWLLQNINSKENLELKNFKNTKYQFDFLNFIKDINWFNIDKSSNKLLYNTETDYYNFLGAAFIF